jgi:hypothetical protein
MPQRAPAGKVEGFLMSNEAKQAETPEELQVVQLLAKALYNVDTRNSQPEDKKARKELWLADKRKRMAQARKVVSQLKRMGVTLSVPEGGGKKPRLKAAEA